MPSSLLMPIPATPANIDLLPLYARVDPDTSSVHSSAPSYISETPTYHSTIPPEHSLVESGPLLAPALLLRQTRRSLTQPQLSTFVRPAPETGRSVSPPSQSTSLHPPQRLGLPPVTYAPGFQRRPQETPTSSSPSILNINVNELRSIYAGPKAQVYRNITARRARKASVEEQLGIMTLTSIPTSLSSASTSPPASPSASSPSSSGRRSLSDYPDPASRDNGSLEGTSDSGPVSPNEDPELVGVEAAAQARSQRIYIESCLADREALNTENMGWDFMLAQMADWKERERSWQRYQGQVQRTRISTGRKKRRR